MADYICHGCNQRKSQSQVFECTRCGKILCQSCKGYSGPTCKDSPKWTAGCSGTFKTK
jgi:hypothetical protein